MATIKRTPVLALALLAGACAAAPPASLVDARAAYQRASTGPAEKLAPAQLHAAQTSLGLAEKTYEDEGASLNARDRAYVAQRKAELAEVQARIAQASAQETASAQRGALAEQKQHNETTNALTETRAALATQMGALAAETERRKQAEQAQEQALAQVGKVTKDPRGTVVTLSGSVIFPSGGSELLPSARSRLSEVATALSQGDAASSIVVEGHTDSVGKAAMNQELSVRRATAVRNQLVADGVPADRVSVTGFGDTRPVADNSSPTGRANNRRVEIVVQPKAE
jgi:outer membrane protein OmpA-like peptidoglycan-associated protein